MNWIQGSHKVGPFGKYSQAQHSLKLTGNRHSTIEEGQSGA